MRDRNSQEGLSRAGSISADGTDAGCSGSIASEAARNAGLLAAPRPTAPHSGVPCENSLPVSVATAAALGAVEKAQRAEGDKVQSAPDAAEYSDADPVLAGPSPTSPSSTEGPVYIPSVKVVMFERQKDKAADKGFVNVGASLSFGHGHEENRPASSPAPARPVFPAVDAAPSIASRGAVIPYPPGAVAASGTDVDAPDHTADRGLWRRGRSLLRRLTKILVYAAAGYIVLCMALIFVYRFIDPPMSNLMIWQRLAGMEISHQWVPLSRISPNLVRAVIASEDARFCQHSGVDFKALRVALKQSRRRRGASTISMQVTKNLFLWNSRSYIRKALEIPLTLLMELVWPKWRVMEVYLNIAEWGEGVFGAEAAAGYHFDKSASRLSPRQAALLAVALPNPVEREAGDPNRQTRRRAARIEKRVRGSAGAAKCVLR